MFDAWHQPWDGHRATSSGATVASATRDFPHVAHCSTFMLRNIPNKYSQQMLVDQLNRNFRGHFDFVYLPMDFKNECNVGYAFVNLRSHDVVEKFMQQFDGVAASICL